MRVVSYTLAVICLLFVILVIIELTKSTDHIKSSDDIWHIKLDHHLISSVCIVNFAYGYMFVILPAYSELENRTNARFARSSIAAIVMCSIAFFCIGISGIFLFGEDL